jgi:diamine N-acetyltransferase
MLAMKTILLIEGGEDLLDDVAPLWQKLNDHHQAKSQHFAEKFSQRTFDHRRAELLNKAQTGFLYVVLAKDLPSGTFVGYCISSIDREKVGEIESIYLEPSHRETGIGSRLMENALKWMDNHSVQSRIIGVGGGNEDVFKFYSRFGFYPKCTILEQVSRLAGK